jgi:hypothetical protein
MVDKVLGSAGPLTKAIRIGCYWETTVAFPANSGPEKVSSVAGHIYRVVPKTRCDATGDHPLRGR